MSRRNFLESGSGAAALLTLATACAREDQKQATGLAELDAVETASRIRSGEISAAEAVEAAIERATRIDKKINAIAFKSYDTAREAAGKAEGPWAGVPTFIKDLDDVTGVPSAFGSRAFPGYKGSAQTPLIDSYFGIGVVSLGKSTTPEFGLTATTEPLNTGATRNPWNLDHSTGGSSGGAAALVASGVVPVAHASDGGGSIRIPASCCGNVGLKVTRGRTPEARPETAGPFSISVQGVQSRTVRDTAAVIAAFEQAAGDTGLPPVGLVTGPAERRLRIGLIAKGPYDRPIDNEVVDAARNVAKICESLGHSVEEKSFAVAPGIEEAFMLYWAKMAWGAVTFWESKTHLKRNGLAFEPFTLGLVDFYEKGQSGFDAGVARLLALTPEFNAMFADVDVLLSPVVAAPPPEIGYLSPKLSYDEHLKRVLDYVQFTSLYNIVGAPAISLPLSMSTSGLPIGAMFGAKIGDEKTLLELSYELEAAAPWSGRKPPLFG